MGRKSIGRTNTDVVGINTTETTVAEIVTPKKGRTAVKVEQVAKAEKASPVAKRKAKGGIDSDEKRKEGPSISPAQIKINSVKSKVALENAPKQKKAPAKRKAKTEDVDDEEGADDTKAKKKRKTKEEKEAEAMPLAARTAIGTLKKAMHIGAHVSGAGGRFSSTRMCISQ